MVTREYLIKKYNWKWNPETRFFVFRNIHINFNLKTNRGQIHSQDYVKLSKIARTYKIPSSKFDIIQNSAAGLTKSINIILDAKRKK